MRPSHWLPTRWAAAFILAAGQLAQPNTALAQSAYRINGIAAPQVVANPLAGNLQAQLSVLQNTLKERSKFITLEQALEAGLLNNPQLAVAYAQIQGQQWNLIAVRRQWVPTANAGSTPYILGQNFRTTTQSTTLPPSNNQTTYSNASIVGGIGLNLNWSFFNLARAPSINAAGESLRRQQLLFDVSARNLVLEIQDSYFRLQEQQQLIRSYEEILFATNRQVATTEAQFNSGLVSIADVEQIRTQQYRTLSTLINAYRQLVDAAAQVAQTMALPAGTLVLPSEQLSPLGRWEASLQVTIDQALRLREEIQASLAASASASWQATALFNSYWPQFNVSASGAYSSSNITAGFPGDILSNNSRILNWDGAVGVGFSWSFFDGGIAAAQAESQKAAALAAKDQAALERLKVTREVEVSYANYLTSLLALESSNAQAMSARSAANAAQERFAAGVTDMATVVQTLNQAIDATNAYATSIRIYNSAVAGLYRSSARWPVTTQLLIEQRVKQLSQR